MSRAINIDANHNIYLEGYPQGSRILGLIPSSSEDLRRLVAFRNDLHAAIAWSAKELEKKHSADLCEPLSDAALIAYCRCFQSTTGHRVQPLSPKRMFNEEQRRKHKRLIAIRNRVTAHDELIFGGSIPLIVMGPDRVALEVVVAEISVPFFGMAEIEHLRELAQVAFDWVAKTFEEAATSYVRGFNSMPAAEREKLAQSEPFKLTAIEADVL